MNITDTFSPQQRMACGFISRQAVFDARRTIWGYELYYRQTLDAERATTHEHKHLLGVATSAFLSPQWQQAPDSYILLDLDTRILAEDITGLLPAGRTVFQVREDLLGSVALQALLARLRQEQFLVSVALLSAEMPAAVVFAQTDLVVVDMQREDSAALLDKARQLRQAHAGLRLQAKGVEDQQVFQAASDGGCTLFQGFFFQKPEHIRNKVVPASLASSLSVLKLVERQDPDLTELARTIQMDVSLSFRLLKFLNSPYFGFTREVSSIKVALILAGWEQMRTWLRLVVLAGMKPKNKPGELVFLSAQRARFLELAAQRAGRTPGGHRLDPEHLLLLGLFSLLDCLFDMRMQDIVGSLPLDAVIKDTLCGQPTPLAPWLQLIHSFERADWGDLSTLLAGLDADPVVVAGAYTESMQWAHSVFNFLE